MDGLRREGVSEEEEGMEVGWEMGIVFGRKRA